MRRSADLSLREFAAALASVDPSPGASCASAVPAALAAGLVAMAARQTAASDAFSDLAEEMESAAAEADELRAGLLAAGEADALAFERAMSARGAAGSGEPQAAYRAAVEPPLRVCGLSLRVLELAADCAERGHPYAVPDAGAAALFAAAAIESAALAIRLEATAIDDEGVRDAGLEQAARARDRAGGLREAALAAVQRKLEAPRPSARVVHA